MKTRTVSWRETREELRIVAFFMLLFICQLEQINRQKIQRQNFDLFYFSFTYTFTTHLFEITYVLHIQVQMYMHAYFALN